MPTVLPARKMPTATSNPRFVIDARADAKLNEISSEFADMILDVAALRTTNRDSHNRPLVDACDIEAAARAICALLRQAPASGVVLTPESEQLLHHFQAVCNAFSHECEQSADDEHSRYAKQ